MNKKTETLSEIVEKFLDEHITADSFEEKFTKIFDFSEITEDENGWNYFKKIRDLLEYYSSSNQDLKIYSRFYINEKQLRQKIIQLRDS